MSNSFGKKFKITVFGESHGKCVGVVVEGCPIGQKIDLNLIQNDLNKRKPGQSELTSARHEDDIFELLSGVFNGKATGAPITMIIKNKDTDSSGYEEIKNIPRPGHADYPAKIKYQNLNDYRGGGIFSGRITAAFVLAGALAKQVLKKRKITVDAEIIQIGNSRKKQDIEKEIIKVKKSEDSIGGLIECKIIGLPVGIGEPLFDSIESVLSHAIFSIPGVKGIEFGSGFKCVNMKGSQHNDPIIIHNGKIMSKTNNAGGILGGLSNGMPVIFRVAIKPTSSISIIQKTVNLEKNKECNLKIRGRHDPCIALRAAPVIEGMAAISILDFLLRENL